MHASSQTKDKYVGLLFQTHVKAYNIIYECVLIDMHWCMPIFPYPSCVSPAPMV